MPRKADEDSVIFRAKTQHCQQLKSSCQSWDWHYPWIDETHLEYKMKITNKKKEDNSFSFGSQSQILHTLSVAIFLKGLFNVRWSLQGYHPHAKERA